MSHVTTKSDNGRRDGWALVAIMALAAWLMAIGMSSPWTLSNDFASAAFANIARNHARYGLEVTGGRSIMRVDRDAPSASDVYAHHPPLYPIVLSAVLRITGETEWVLRLVAICCSLAAVLTLFALVRSVSGSRVALWTAGLMALAPVQLVYGRLVSLEQPVVLFLILSTWMYVRWSRRPNSRRFAELVVVLTVGMMIEWQAYYLPVLFAVHVAWRRESWRAIWPQLVALLILGPAMFSLFVLHLLANDSSLGKEIADTFMFRAGIVDPDERSFVNTQYTSYGPLQLVGTLGGRIVKWVSPLTAIVGGLVVVVSHLRSWRQSQTENAACDGISEHDLVVLLFAPALCHTLLFSNTMFVHNSLTVFFLPAMAYGTGLAVCRLLSVDDLAAPARARMLVWSLAAATLVYAVAITFHFNRQRFLPPYDVGRELADATAADDDVALVGFPYYPVVEWYADRDLHFLNDPTAGGEDFAAWCDRHDIRAVAVYRPWLDATNTPADRRLDRRNRDALAVLESIDVAHPWRPARVTERLIVYIRDGE